MSPARIALQTSGALSKAGTGCGGSGRSLSRGQVDRGVELEEIGEGGEALARVEVVGLELQLVDQRGQDVGGQVGVVLQADRVAHPPLAQARLDAREQVPAAARAELEIGVAGDADGVAERTS